MAVHTSHSRARSRWRGRQCAIAALDVAARQTQQCVTATIQAPQQAKQNREPALECQDRQYKATEQ